MTSQDRRPNTLLKWLTPGIGVKRWLGLLMLGVVLLGLGMALLLLHLHSAYPGSVLPTVLTLGGSPFWLRAGMAGVVGLALIMLSLIRINQSILRPHALQGSQVIEALVEHSQRRRGPKVVAIGGGTGLPVLLRGLKEHTSNITAIVTVADDGGSSGRLRRDLGVLPPGDFRNNLVALARDESLLAQLFQYRFGEGGLEGHSFGNLFITAMSSVTGSFERALIESSRVLAIQGRVLPSTLSDVTLVADLRESESNHMRRVAGEAAIPEVAGAIERVFLQPDDIRPYPEAVSAILSADLIVLGPGSLFTSILPNLLVHGIPEAIRASQAMKVYVCNVATQRGETEGFSVVDHVQAIERHVGKGLFDIALINDDFLPLSPDSNFAYVQLAGKNGADPGLHVHEAPLVDTQYPWRHDSRRLAQAIMGLLAKSRPAAPPLPNT